MVRFWWGSGVSETNPALSAILRNPSTSGEGGEYDRSSSLSDLCWRGCCGGEIACRPVSSVALPYLPDEDYKYQGRPDALVTQEHYFHVTFYCQLDAGQRDFFS